MVYDELYDGIIVGIIAVPRASDSPVVARPSGDASFTKRALRRSLSRICEATGISAVQEMQDTQSQSQSLRHQTSN